MRKDAREMYDVFNHLKARLRSELFGEIVRLLNKVDGKRVELDLETDDAATVSYDGGNHPEYDSNCFATVKAVFINEKGRVCVEIEEDDEYWLEDVWSVEEVYGVLEFVDWKVNGDNEEEED